MQQSISHLSSDQEVLLVWKFFHQAKRGTFVEVGANHPTLESQTWLMEQQGWTGVLIEPNPSLGGLLRAQRPRSQVFQVAVGNPGQVGEVDLQIGAEDQLSTIIDTLGQPLSGVKVRVPLRTLDFILAEAGLEQIDFLAIDVEGMELAVLQGFNIAKYRPQLILLEEHRRDYKKHFHLRRHGYRLVKRTRLNNWYVPNDSPATVASQNTMGEAWQMWRKMWLNTPFDNLKRNIRNRLRTMLKHKSS
jgi:FkbM family methyltransferase